jgi:hypothetical protein
MEKSTAHGLIAVDKIGGKVLFLDPVITPQRMFSTTSNPYRTNFCCETLAFY